MIEILNSSPSGQIRKHSLYALSRIFEKQSNLDWDSTTKILSAVSQVLLNSEDINTIENSLKSIETFSICYSNSDMQPLAVQTLLGNGILPKLVQLCEHPTYSVAQSALEAIEFISSNQPQLTIDSGVLSTLGKICCDIEKYPEAMKRVVFLVISNLFAGSRVQATIESLFPYLFQILDTSFNESTRNEAHRAMCKIISVGNSQQIQFLVSQQKILEVFFSRNNYWYINHAAMAEALSAIVKEGENQKIYFNGKNPYIEQMVELGVAEKTSENVQVKF